MEVSSVALSFLPEMAGLPGTTGTGGGGSGGGWESSSRR